MDEQRGEDLEALQARLRTLQAEIAAELQHASAAEAVIAASRAAVEEAGLASPSPTPSLGGVRGCVLVLGAALILVASVGIGLGVRRLRLDEAEVHATASYQLQVPAAERELIGLERQLSQARLSVRPCASGRGYGQRGASPEGTRSVDPAAVGR